MEIYNHRFKSGKDSSLGVLNFEQEPPFCFIPEDEARLIKVMGETRIPAGRYRLMLCKFDTPLTIKHRQNKAYSGWFNYHIEVTKVPKFTGVFFHIGNDDDDTEGCQMPNFSGHITGTEFKGSESSFACKKFYERVEPLLEKGIEVWYNVIDL